MSKDKIIEKDQTFYYYKFEFDMKLLGGAKFFKDAYLASQGILSEIAFEDKYPKKVDSNYNAISNNFKNAMDALYLYCCDYRTKPLKKVKGIDLEKDGMYIIPKPIHEKTLYVVVQNGDIVFQEVYRNLSYEDKLQFIEENIVDKKKTFHYLYFPWYMFDKEDERKLADTFAVDAGEMEKEEFEAKYDESPRADKWEDDLSSVSGNCMDYGAIAVKGINLKKNGIYVEDIEKRCYAVVVDGKIVVRYQGNGSDYDDDEGEWEE